MKLEKWVGSLLRRCCLSYPQQSPQHLPAQHSMRQQRTDQFGSMVGRTFTGPRLIPPPRQHHLRHFRAHRQCPATFYLPIQVTQFTSESPGPAIQRF